MRRLLRAPRGMAILVAAWAALGGAHAAHAAIVPTPGLVLGSGDWVTGPCSAPGLVPEVPPEPQLGQHLYHGDEIYTRIWPVDPGVPGSGPPIVIANPESPGAAPVCPTGEAASLKVLRTGPWRMEVVHHVWDLYWGGWGTVTENESETVEQSVDFKVVNPETSLTSRHKRMLEIRARSSRRTKSMLNRGSAACGLAAIVAPIPGGGCAAVLQYLASYYEDRADECDELADDPPRSDFRRLTVPQPRPVRLRGRGAAGAAAARVANTYLASVARESAYVAAVRISLERAQGARKAGQRVWMWRQIIAAHRHAAKLAPLLTAQPSLARSARRRLAAAGLRGPALAALRPDQTRSPLVAQWRSLASAPLPALGTVLAGAQP